MGVLGVGPLTARPPGAIDCGIYPQHPRAQACRAAIHRQPVFLRQCSCDTATERSLECSLFLGTLFWCCCRGPSMVGFGYQFLSMARSLAAIQSSRCSLVL